MQLTFLSIFILFISSEVSSSYKIFVYNPKFGGSHVTFGGKLADTLVSAGHDVVVYQPVFTESITFSGTKNKSVRYYVMPKDKNVDFNFSLESAQEELWKEKSFMKNLDVMVRFKRDFCRTILKDTANLEKLRLENFDLGMTELFEPCGLGIIKYLGIKRHITTFSAALNPLVSSILGLQWTPSYVPGGMGLTTDQMGFWERFLNFLSYVPDHFFSKALFFGEVESVIREKLPEFNMIDTVADSAFYFVNSDEHIDYAQPITHKIIYIGGLGKVQYVPLEQKYLDIFSSAKRGVIFFSFGSVVQSNQMRPDIKKAFLDAFAEFPDIKFIWKYEKDKHQVAKGYANVFTGKWLPQNELLEHPRLLAFISHAGMNSIIEGASRGVPMICIPVFADQKRNAKLLERRGMAVLLDKTQLSKKSVVAAINQLLSNPSYKANAQLLSRMVKAKPITAEERVVKYTEFAAQFGDTDTLQLQGRYLSFVQLYSLDVIFVLLVGLGVVLVLLVWLVRRLVEWTKMKMKNSLANGNIKKKN